MRFRRRQIPTAAAEERCTGTLRAQHMALWPPAAHHAAGCGWWLEGPSIGGLVGGQLRRCSLNAVAWTGEASKSPNAFRSPKQGSLSKSKFSSSTAELASAAAARMSLRGEHGVSGKGAR